MFGTPGEPVPTVSAEDIKAVWKLGRESEARSMAHSPELKRGQIAIGVELGKHVCRPGADIRAVWYRGGMLGLLEMGDGELLAPWKQRDGELQEIVFKSIATMLMTWMAVGVPQRGLPFDLNAFFRKLEKATE